MVLVPTGVRHDSICVHSVGSCIGFPCMCRRKAETVCHNSGAVSGLPVGAHESQSSSAKCDYCRISNNRTDFIRATGDDEVFVKIVAFAADGTGDFMK